MLDHLGVVVGGQVALLLDRQPADEVRQPHVGGALELRVLVQVVVELPGLVADPQVVGLLAHEVVEDHEVRDQDLVHPAPGLEAVQVVLGRLGLDVGGLVGQQRAGGVDALALGLQHARDRVLRQPVDLEVGVQRAQLLRDRDVAPRVAEADGGGDEQRALAAAAPAGPGALRGRWRSANSRSSRLTLIGSRACGPWPEPSSVTSSPPVALRQRHALRVRAGCGPGRRGSRARGT